MTAIRIAIASIWVAIVLISRSNGMATIPGGSFPLDDSRLTSSFHPGERAGGAAGTHRPRVDVYGNVIESAVGDYRIDVRGDVYEHHDPDTAVAELGPPGA